MSKVDISDGYFMQLALKEARQAFDNDEIPVGAVIVSGGRLIARARNMTEALGDVTAHAEILAITAASIFLGGKFLSNCTLYVTLEPCAMCAGALYWARPARLVYGASDDKRGYRNFSPSLLHPRTSVTSGLMADECAGLIKSFFKSKREGI